jgi:hypothetical protein
LPAANWSFPEGQQVFAAGGCTYKVDGEYELSPHGLQEPHPPIFHVERLAQK